MSHRRHTRSQLLGLTAALLLVGSFAVSTAQAAPAPDSVHRQDNRRFHRSTGYSFATFNVMNLYRPRPLDPSSGIGRQPKRQKWMPQSETAYRDKLRRVAKSIIDLGTPDVIALQEIENFKRSTKLREKSVLHALVGEIKRQTTEAGSEVVYNYAQTPGDSDRRGISNGFIYRADRVRLADRDPTHPVVGRRPTDTYKKAARAANPKSLDTPSPSSIVNDGQGKFTMSRSVLVGRFEIFKDRVGEGTPEEVFVLNNHLKSNPAMFQRRRTEQAKLNAKLVEQIAAHNSKASIIVAGDMNADYNQDPHKNQIAPLESHTPAVKGTPNLLDNLTARLNAAERFSYVYRNKDQLLDWVYASSGLSSRLIDVRIPHGNTKSGDETLISSDHDPVVARFKAFE